jgi:hypothetical protein
MTGLLSLLIFSEFLIIVVIDRHSPTFSPISGRRRQPRPAQPDGIDHDLALSAAFARQYDPPR